MCRCNGANVRRQSRQPLPKVSNNNFSLILSFTFGVVLIATMLAIVVAIPHPSAPQFEVFRIVIAVAVAGVAATIPGFLTANDYQCL